MVYIRMKIGDEWATFQITPMTVKSATETLQRIPKGPHQRTIFLSQVINEPRMTQWEWGEVPTIIIHRLILCIMDLLNDYRKMKHECLSIISEMSISGNTYSLSKLEKLAKKRDNLIEGLKEIESVEGVVTYSDEKINKLMEKPKPLYIGSTQ